MSARIGLVSRTWCDELKPVISLLHNTMRLPPLGAIILMTSIKCHRCVVCSQSLPKVSTQRSSSLTLFKTPNWFFFPSTQSLQFSSVTQSYSTLCDPMNRSRPGLPVQHQLPEFTQTHVHRVDDAIQPSHPLLSPSPPTPNPSQHQGLFQWVKSSHEVAKILEFQLQHQSFQWTPRTDLF